ncbi:RDD family protein [Malacoplasma penetrans]|uniref:Uncharacterized protein n=1 Tax=Malacoplasma penetrans (strain HF-2) TaxID=272633 RepID=Q8EUM9_MALP2|nr:RDD family protein [Malacoplasma penetrans]RXY97096.1 RDD family protein [Malacoplasma penetrans]BAC44683.1 conserved hypothetical protein [Malacoplasma penetrans HF-2]
MDYNLDKNQKKKYNLASALSRTLTRFLDLILVFLILVAIFFAIFSNYLNYNFSSTNNPDLWYSIDSWRIFLFTFFVFVIFLSYFVFVPFVAQGYTLFSKIFKIRIYSTSLKLINENRKIFKNIHFLFLVQLLVRELLTTILISFAILILGIVALFDKKDVIDFLLNQTRSDTLNGSTNNVVAIVFQAFFTCIGLLNIVLIVNVACTSRKRSFTDHISSTVVVKMVETYSDEKNNNLNYKNKKQPVIKYNLPGEINPDEIFDKETN